MYPFLLHVFANLTASLEFTVLPSTPNIHHYDFFIVFRSLATIVHISLYQSLVFSVIAAADSLFN